MKRVLIAAVLAAAALPPASAAFAQQPQLSGQEARKVVENGCRAWMDTYIKHDARAIAALFTDDGVFLPPDGSPMVQGRDALEGRWAQQFQSIGGHEDLTIEAAIPAGNDAIVAILDWAITTDRGPNAGQIVRGRTANTLARTSDGWKIAVIAPQLAPAAESAPGSSTPPTK
jgi:uncharacterized protein (TIGR02246 family)